MPIEQYGYRDMHAKMDRHVQHEDNRAEPRRTNDRRRKDGKFDKTQHRAVTQGVRVKRGETVVYPYGGKPMETIVRPLSAKQQERKRTVEHQIDQVGKQVARDASATRKGCALITVHPTEVTAFAYKIRAALKGGQVRDRLDGKAGGRTRNQLHETTGSKHYVPRSVRVLAELDNAAKTGATVALGVYTRAELKIIGAQRIKPKYVTRHVRNLERKLAGKR